MDARLNPYTPGAGSPPPALAGREQELERFDVLLYRLERGMPTRSVVWTGLRGMGKTVLLDTVGSRAQERDWLTLSLEARAGIDMRVALSDGVDSLIADLDRGERTRAAMERLRGWLPTLRGTLSSSGDVSLELGSPQQRAARLERDVVELIERLGSTARAAQRGVLLLLDELQQLDRDGMESLCAAMHRASRDRTPIALVAAGLPNLPRLLIEAKSYAERLFVYPKIDRLDPDASRQALAAPVRGLDPGFGEVSFEPTALDRMVSFADGYPMALQTIGTHTWTHARGPRIEAADVARAEPLAFAELGESLFSARWSRATERQRDYLAALAQLGDGAGSGEVAHAAGYRSAQAATSVRDQLISAGLIYSPAHGQLAFTVPHFDRFIREHGRDRSQDSGLGLEP